METATFLYKYLMSDLLQIYNLNSIIFNIRAFMYNKTPGNQLNLGKRGDSHVLNFIPSASTLEWTLIKWTTKIYFLGPKKKIIFQTPKY